MQAFEAGLPTPAGATQVAEPAAIPKTEVVPEVLLPTKKRPSAMPKIAIGVGAVAAVVAAAFFLAPWEQLTGSKPAGTATVVGSSAGPIVFEAGSTPAEREAALALCVKTLKSGCAVEDYEDETLRTVTLAPVAFDTHEVTNREFATFVSETRHETTAERAGFSWDPFAKGTKLSWRAPTRSASYQDRPDHPVVHVSLADASAYCRAQGKRLPTEDEWELAARSTERNVFPWGSEWAPDRAVWRADGTRPVGSIPAGATREGLQDMAGNVWEWTSTKTERETPIVKGGSWFEHNGALLRGATRMELDSGSWTSADIGFRCVKDR